MSESPPAVATVYEQIRAAELAERSRAYKITTRAPPKKGSYSGHPGYCVRCVNAATIEMLFYYRTQQSEEWRHIWTNEEGWFTWIVVEKYCDSCAKASFPDVVATSASEVKKDHVS